MRQHRATVLAVGVSILVSLAGCVADSTKSASDTPASSPLAFAQGKLAPPAAPSSSSEGTGGAAGKETGGSKAAPPMVEGELALPVEAGQVQESPVLLTQAVHFTDAKGQDVVVGPGSYRVEAEGTNRIRLLLAETGEAVVIDAVSFTHQQTVERPVPVTVPDPQQPDVLHLALLSPGGTGLDAIGTYSGVKPRAVTDMMFVTSQIGLQYTAQTSQLAIVSGITAPTTGTMAPPDPPSVVIYEHSNFGGRFKTLGIGLHRLSDFNEIASSIKVPKGLVALLYEHADAGGGYGIEVDVLEDRPDLSRLNFNDKLSYLTVISSPDSLGRVWVRNSVQNGQFQPGHWEAPRASGTPVNNMIAVVSPPAPPHRPAYQPPIGVPPPNDRKPIPKLAKFRILELHSDPSIFLDNTTLHKFILIYECRIETGPCSSRHDVRNVFWTIRILPPLKAYSPGVYDFTPVFMYSDQVLHGKGNHVCEGAVRRKYPHGGCLVGEAYGGQTLGGRGKDALFSVILALAGEGKTPYATLDINDPQTVVVDFLTIPAPARKWPHLKIGGPRIRDHR